MVDLLGEISSLMLWPKGEDRSMINLHFPSLFFFRITPIGLIWVPLGHIPAGSLIILLKETSLAKYSEIIDVTWLGKLLVAFCSACILLHPIQNPFLIHILQIICLSGALSTVPTSPISVRSSPEDEMF